MFRIKVCGVTSVGDALAAADAGATAIGLNFYPPSPRFVAEAQAERICAALRGAPLEIVGVFVNAAVDDMRRIADQLELTRIQLHGDEPADVITELGPHGVVRAARCAAGESLMDASRRVADGPPPANLSALLVDAWHPQLYGGSGRQVARDGLGRLSGPWEHIPWVLAGGLTPANVGQAIREARPHAVDTASGVETAPGVKSATMLRAFVSAAQAAFAELETQTG